MDPNSSPVSSPLKSIPSSPLRSLQSSPLQSIPSSPIVEIPSSPLQYVSSPEQTPSKPFQSSTPGKRKLDLLQVEEPTVAMSNNEPSPRPEKQNKHCRELFFNENVNEGDEVNPGSSILQECDAYCDNNIICVQGTDRDGMERGNVDSSIAAANIQLLEGHKDQSVPSFISGKFNSVFELTDSSSEEFEDTSSSSEAYCSSTSSEECAESEPISTSESEREDNDARYDSSSSSDDEVRPFFSPKVSKHCDLTKDEGVLILMEMFTKYQLSKKVTGAMLKSVLKFLPEDNTMPKTEYALFQHVLDLSPIGEEITHYYCSDCLYYLGLHEISCAICKGKSADKFFQIPLADQIKNLFENHGLADEIDKYADSRKDSNVEGYISDLLDGSEFQNAQIDGNYNLTLMGHTDGIPVSESSFVSLWPLEWIIAQLAPYLRYRYVLISGIWLGCKPYMNTYLRPFVAELKALRECGVKWTHPRSKQVHTTHVTVPCFCVDAPVRAQLQNILTHGGIHCCHICEQKMKKLPEPPVQLGEKKKARRRVFTFEEETQTLRTAERMDRQGEEARRKYAEKGAVGKLKPEKGVKGPSLISEIPGCDRSSAVFPEYMHLLLNLIKEFMSLWFLKDGPWSLKQHRDTINKFLLSIRVPDFITRIPRSTEHFSKWKANELRSFLLFFSLIILSRCMKPEYFQHWLLLVCAFNMLLQDSVSKKDVKRADILLKMFCRDFPALYKFDFYTYYVHNLSHLALVVERHGPLHCNSAFMLESFNGTLAKYIHGTKNQGKELVKNVKLACGVEVLRARTQSMSQTSEGDRPLKIPMEFKNEIKGYVLSDADIKLLPPSNVNKIKVYYRAVINAREIFTCSLYTRQKRRNNYTVRYTDSSQNTVFGEINFFCEMDGRMLAFVERFDIDHMRTLRHTAGIIIKHILPIIPTGKKDVIELKAIQCKVIRIENFVCLRPNKHEYNL